MSAPSGTALARRCGTAGRAAAAAWSRASAAAKRKDAPGARRAAEEALALFSEVDPLGPLCADLGAAAPEAWGHAVRALSLDSPRAAAEAWRRASEEAPESPWAWAWRAKALEAAGETAEAARAHERAAALAPGSGWVRAWRGGFWLRTGDPRALPELAEAVRLDPGYPFGRAWLGGALRRAGRLTEARAELEAALEAEPCYEWTYGELAELHCALGRAEDAARFQAEAYLRDPKRVWPGEPPAGRGPFSKAWRAHDALSRGDAASARKALGRAAAREPAFLTLQRALAAAAAGETAAARALAEDAARKAPHERTLAAAGRACLAAGDARGAARWLARAAEANDSVVETRRALAAALRASGRAAEAGREEAAAAALEGGSARPGARTLDVFLNYACQAKCAFCYNPPLTPELTAWTLPMPRLAAELTKGRRAGYDGVTYSGGEVTLLPDLPQRVALARKAGYRSVGVITNGIRLADPAYAALLADCGLTFAVVSIHGADAAVHDRRVAVPGAFAKALKALENLRARGVLLVLNFVLTREDGSQAAAFVERFAGEPGVAELQLYYPHYDGLAAVNAGALRLPFAAAAAPLRAALSAARRLGAQERVFLYNVPPCIIPEAEEQLRNWAEEPEALLVDPKGLEDGRFGSERRGRVKTAECARCVHGPRCLGFEQGYVAAFGSGEMKAVPLILPSPPRGEGKLRPLKTRPPSPASGRGPG